MRRRRVCTLKIDVNVVLSLIGCGLLWREGWSPSLNQGRTGCDGYPALGSRLHLPSLFPNWLHNITLGEACCSSEMRVSLVFSNEHGDFYARPFCNQRMRSPIVRQTLRLADLKRFARADFSESKERESLLSRHLAVKKSSTLGSVALVFEWLIMGDWMRNQNSS